MQLELFAEHPPVTEAARPRAAAESLVGRVFHASWGHDAALNTFAVVLQEGEKSVVLVELLKQRVSGGDAAGVERPILPTADGPPWRAGADFRLRKKRAGNGSVFLQQKLKTFRLWDREDRRYDSG